jgi:hypothetical protein
MLFSFGRRDVANRLKQSTVIEPINPLEGGELNGMEVTPGPAAINELGLVEADEKFQPVRCRRNRRHYRLKLRCPLRPNAGYI